MENLNCCGGNCNQNSEPKPQEISQFIKDISNVIINLKKYEILSQSTIDHANDVAVSALNKVEELIKNIPVKNQVQEEAPLKPEAPTSPEVM